MRWLFTLQPAIFLLAIWRYYLCNNQRDIPTGEKSTKEDENSKEGKWFKRVSL